VYLTVEEVDDARTDAAFARSQATGLPTVRGEVVEGDVAGYHHYPGRERTLGWFEAEGLAIVAEAVDQEEGWGYRHWLLRTPGD
jgi:hypothetical protein